MSDPVSAFQAHLANGLTTVSHAWAITRTDGMEFGFTDHDQDLQFDGITFRADTGLSALALSQGTGLSVDNTEAVGALNDASIREDDIEQGRFDDAVVRAWLINWADPDQRALQFRGTIGELRRTDGGFQAELRGLTEALNRPLGRVYQKPCTAVLGDSTCRFNPMKPGYSHQVEVEAVVGARVFEWPVFEGFDAEWFTRGRMDILDGPAKGLWGMIKQDRLTKTGREIELWEPVRAEIGQGTRVRLTAGCDKRSETCRLKFDNFINFQGFPDIPGEDWVMAVPKSGGVNTGVSLR